MRGQVRLTVVAALATALTSLVFSLVFDYGGWLTPVLGAILVTAATGAVARHWRLPRFSVPFWQVIALFCWLVFVFARNEAFWWIIPTTSAIEQIGDVFATGFDDVNRYATPVAPFRGIVALAVAGIGLCHIAVDTLAVTLRRPALAGLPLLALYCVPSTLAPGGVGWGGVVLGAGGWLALLVADARLRFTAWGRPLGYGRGDRATEREYHDEIQTTPLSALGRRIGAASLGVAVIVPIIVPGLDESVFGRGGAGGEGDGQASVTVQNPMVDLQRDLTRPEDRTIIRYTTDDPQPDYLRLVTLDSFDGIAWERATFDTPRRNRVRGQELPVPVGLSESVARELRTTQLRVLDEADSWLPMPYPPQRVQIEGGDWRFDNETLNVVAQDGSTIRNAEYEVMSLDLQPTTAQLRAAPAADSDYDRYLELPPGLPDEVRTEARDVVAEATTPYDRALALQDWFRDTSVWTYSTAVREGHGNAALSAFLEDRTGYCEQFAATMAVMARSIGIPARVNVGFTPGTRVEDEWVVSLHDAHAWPELYFPGVGWVRFEPTPLADGRGIDPEYAGPAAERVDPADPAAAQPAPTAAATPGANSLAEQDARLEGDDQLAGGGAASSGPPRWPFVAALVVAVLAIAPRVTRSVVRRRRFADRADPRATAEAAWAEVRDTVRDYGYAWSTSETPRQAAHRLSDEAFIEQPGREAFATLARVVERARYARDPGNVDDLSVEVDVVRRGLAAPLSRVRQWRAQWLPASSADVLQAAIDRITDALDWLDAAVARWRERLTPRRWRRAPG
jgi:transglutaminase-like putative cysteine protease